MAGRSGLCLRLLLPLCRGAQCQNGLVPMSRSFFGGRNWDPFSDLQTAVREMERNSREMERAFNRMTMPRFFPSLSSSRSSVPVQASDGNMHRINLDLSGFKPEDVKVTLKDKMVTIEAKMEQKSEDGSRLYQEITRQYTLPDNVEAEQMKSLYSNEGILSIEAPLTSKRGEGPTEIPISRDGDQK